MRRRRRRRFAQLSALLVALACAAPAAADTFSAWTGTKGGFAWEARRLTCGNVGDSPSRIRAHTRWRTSPANGYLRLTFTRQVRDEVSGTWATVHKQRRSTKNQELEGSRAVVHWSQWFYPFEGEAGALTRHTVVFEWLRDRAGPRPDRRALRRVRTFAPCQVAA